MNSLGTSMEHPYSIRRDGCHKKNGFVAGSKKKPPGVSRAA